MTARPRLLLNLARPWGETDPLTLARQAVDAGLDGVGLADSPRLMPDCWLESERVLGSTSAALAGPVVASLGLRHPATVAGALRTLEGHHPGRAFAVVGRGESSVRNEGLPVPSLGSHGDGLAAVRDRLRTEDGADLLPGRLLGAASGPRTITVTARALGGVLLDVGTDPDTVRRAAMLAWAEDPSTSVWLFLRALVVPDEAQAASAAAALLGSCASRMAAAPAWFGLDDEQLALVRVVADRHDYLQHGSTSATAVDDDEAARLVRERFLLVAPAAHVTQRLAALTRLVGTNGTNGTDGTDGVDGVDGIDGVVLAGGLPGVVPGLADLAAAVRAGLNPHPAEEPS